MQSAVGTEQEQCKKVRFKREEQWGGDGSAEHRRAGGDEWLAEVRTGRGSPGLTRGEDERRRTDETSGRGKEKGPG